MKKKLLSTIIISNIFMISFFSFANGQVFELQDNTTNNTVNKDHNSSIVKTVPNATEEDDNDIILDNTSEDIITPVSTIPSVSPWMTMIQSKTRDYNIIEKNLQNGQNANQSIFDGSTILHVAAWQNDSKLFILGLQYGATLSNTNKNGDTALHWAAYSNNPVIISSALSNTSNLNIINKKNKFGRTALHFNALKWGNIDVAKILISNKADLNIQDNNGQTPLHYALSAGKWELAKLYIDSGADISIKDNNGDSIDEYVLEKGNIDAFLLLFKYLNTDNQTIIKARLASINITP